MTTTMKTFVAFVLTVFFIMSSAHCRTTTGGSPGNWLLLYLYYLTMDMFLFFVNDY